MADKKPSPCLTCTIYKDPQVCERKTCPAWSSWWLRNWERIHAYWEKYGK